MSDPLYGFRGRFDNYNDAVASEQTEANLHSWLQWSLLGIGAFENITKGQQGRYGDDRSAMKLAQDPRFNSSASSGVLWEGMRTDWVWETGVAYGTQPTQASGVWVNNTFYGTGTTGTYAHRINYPLGQVVFSTPIPATSTVQVVHSPRFVQVRRSDEPWFHQFVYGSFRPDQNPPGGTGIVLAENRIQFPCIVIEPTMNVRRRPLEIGGPGHIRQEDFILHCMAETPWDRRKLAGILENQKDKRIPTFDTAAVTPPLDAYGRPSPSSVMYPDMCESHPWAQTRVMDVTSTIQPTVGRSLYWSSSRLCLESDGVY